MSFEDLYKWESMSVSGILYVVVKWLNYESVKFELVERGSVESGIWYTIELWEKTDQPHASGYISSQRDDLLKKRLIEFLDNKNHRPK
jgi:hypothetical protein